jgi:hypothetical protein
VKTDSLVTNTLLLPVIKRLMNELKNFDALKNQRDDLKDGELSSDDNDLSKLKMIIRP